MTMLQDRADIADLLSRYALSADRQDYTELVDCFTADAVLEMAHGRLEGIDAIRASMSGEALAAARAKNSGLQFDRSTHLTGNVLIEVNCDIGTAESSAVVYLVGPGPAGDLMAIRGAPIATWFGASHRAGACRRESTGFRGSGGRNGCDVTSG